MIIAIISAIIGCTQSFLFLSTGSSFTLIDQFGGMDTQFKPTPIGMVMRASALNCTVQHLSAFLLLSLPFFLFNFTKPNQEKPIRMLLVVFLMLATILLTWNYVAFFSCAVILILFPFVRWPNYSLQIILAMMLFLMFAYYIGLLQWIYSVSIGDAGVSKGLMQRMALFEFGLESMQENIWLGSGLRSFAESDGNFWHRPVHNAYFQAFTELGLLGGLLFIVMLLTLFTQLCHISLIAKNHTELLRPAILGFIAILCLMIGEPMLDNSNTWMYLGLTQSMLSIIRKEYSLPVSG